jgi:hypothetical protein
MADSKNDLNDVHETKEANEEKEDFMDVERVPFVCPTTSMPFQHICAKLLLRAFESSSSEPITKLMWQKLPSMTKRLQGRETLYAMMLHYLAQWIPKEPQYWWYFIDDYESPTSIARDIARQQPTIAQAHPISKAMCMATVAFSTSQNVLYIARRCDMDHFKGISPTVLIVQHTMMKNREQWLAEPPKLFNVALTVPGVRVVLFGL